MNVVPREKCTFSALHLLFGEVGRGEFYTSKGEKCPMDKYHFVSFNKKE